MTRKPEVRIGTVQHEKWYVVAVNIDTYVEEAERANPAMSFFGTLAPVDPVQMASLDTSSLGQDATLGLVAAPVHDLASVRQWLSANPDSRTRVLETLLELQSDEPIEPILESIVKGREAEALTAAMTGLGDQAWALLGGDLPAAVAHQRIWTERRAALDEFKNRLNDEKQWLEADWQSFFEEQSWIFGFGLDVRFLHLVKDKPYVGGKSFHGPGSSFSDYLYATAGELQFTVLVEIKRPDFPLVQESSYRPGVHAIGQEVAGGIAQLQTQVSKWAIQARTEETSDALERDQIYTREPRSILVVGRLSELRGDLRTDKGRMYAFESFRRNLHQPEILTFDEVYARAEQVLSTQDTGPSGQRDIGERG